jgi:hypothetical protein
VYIYITSFSSCPLSLPRQTLGEDHEAEEGDDQAADAGEALHVGRGSRHGDKTSIQKCARLPRPQMILAHPHPSLVPILKYQISVNPKPKRSGASCLNGFVYFVYFPVFCISKTNPPTRPCFNVFPIFRVGPQGQTRRTSGCCSQVSLPE